MGGLTGYEGQTHRNIDRIAVSLERLADVAERVALEQIAREQNNAPAGVGERIAKLDKRIMARRV